MKIFSSLFLLILPISLIGQDDYCPCMEFENSYNNVSDYTTSVNSETLYTSVPDNNTNPIPQAFGILLPPLPATPTPPQPTSETAEQTQTTQRSNGSRRSNFKKTKYPWKSRVKKRKKAKKYRGKCPIF